MSEVPARPGRGAALVMLSLGGVAAITAWSLLIWDLLAWQAPRIAVVPPIPGAVLPRVEVVRTRAELGTAPAEPAPAGSSGSAPAPPAEGDTEADAAAVAASPVPEAQRRLDEAMARVQAMLDAQREPIRARTTGTAPPQIELPRDVVTCGGLRARGASRIAYLIDCSARSEPHIEVMIDEVLRSVSRLDDAQSFAVIACRKDWAEVAPPGAMRKGGTSFGSAMADDLRAWLRERATPAAAPQIYAGIEAAMATRPDLVVLVSAGLANPGDGDDVRDAAIGACERANPRDASAGRRPARIMTLVAGGQDPQGVMSAIAAAHADGAPLTGTLVPATTPREGADSAVAESPAAPPPDSDARLISAMRIALADPADPASARALLEATVLAEALGWPREHVVRMANAASRRAEALGLDQIASDADRLARRAAEGAPR
jgi:hypothetical protein